MPSSCRQLRRSLLDLNNQLEAMRGEMAKLRGSNEQLLRDVAELQRKQKDLGQAVDDRMRKLEPQKVVARRPRVHRRPRRKAPVRRGHRAAARGRLRQGRAGAVAASSARYPASGYGASARFWQGNAQYGKRDYKEAIAAFRALPGHGARTANAPEALLAIANCQVELKDQGRRAQDDGRADQDLSEVRGRAGRQGTLASLK